MKKFWLNGLALSLGLIGATASLGQYPSNPYQNNYFGPSSYPVQSQPPMGPSLQGLPQVPATYHMQPDYRQPAFAQPMQQQVPYQLVNSQDSQGVLGQPTQNFVPPPLPQPQGFGGQGYGGQGYGGPAHGVPANAAHDGGLGGQGNCNTCGPAASNLQYGYQQQLAPAAVGYCQTPLGSQVFGQPVGGLGGQHAAGLPMGAKPWFFGGGVLLFNRVDDTNVPLSFSSSDYSADILTTRDARMGISPGFEVMMGRYFNCGRNAIQASYWGIFPDDETVVRARTMPGDYTSRLPFTYMTMPGTPGDPSMPYPVADWFNNAYTHQLTRSSSYHNVEVNLLGFAIGGAARNFNLPTAGTMFSGLGAQHGGAQHGGCCHCGGAGCGTCASSKYATGPCCLTAPACGSRLNLTWLAGFRYFHFSDNLLYAASLDNPMITRAADDLYYEVNTTNDLFGAQIGSRADYCIGQRINTYASVRAGIYNNRSTMFTALGTDFEDAYLNDTRTPANPNDGQAYRFDETKNDVAFLSELGSGVGLRVSPKWTATVGYRAVIASGVATAPNNLRSTFANYDDVRDFDNRGTLILHGVNIGALYNF